MLLVDVLFRFPSITLLLLLALLAFRDGRNSAPTRYAALVCITSAAMLLGTLPAELRLPYAAHVVVRMLDIPSIGLVWWFGCSLFDDEFRLGRLQWAGMIVLFIPVLLFRFDELEFISPLPGYFAYFVSAISILLMVHLVGLVIVGRKDDMIESRRRSRFYFVSGLVLVTVMIVIAERVFYPTYAEALSAFRAAAILPLVLGGVFWVVRVMPEKLSFQSSSQPVSSEPQVDPRDQLLHDALMQQITQHHVYREAGLSIRSLAETLGAPEHRLRALINQGLGYRNFSSFLNKYRIAAVQQAMHQPENARIPVLTLAMDQGFNSLAPFNRGFLSETGMTPSAYRAQLYDSADGN